MSEIDEPRLDEWRSRVLAYKLGGGQARIDKQHAKGKMTARERINTLFDQGSFQELQPYTVAHPEDPQAYHGDGVITGQGTINGRITILQGSIQEGNK